MASRCHAAKQLPQWVTTFGLRYWARRDRAVLVENRKRQWVRQYCGKKKPQSHMYQLATEALGVRDIRSPSLLPGQERFCHV